jgi:hypothetical protein
MQLTITKPKSPRKSHRCDHLILFRKEDFEVLIGSSYYTDFLR